MIDPKKALVIVSAYPDHHVSVQLHNWLARHKLTEICYMNKGPYIPARNQAVNTAVTQIDKQGFQHVLFMDKDLRPDQRGTDRWLEVPGDLVGCQYDNGNERAWSNPDHFHTAIWRASARALKIMRSQLGCGINCSWMEYEYNAAKTEVTACECVVLARKARSVGLSVRHGGWCDHPAGGNSWCSGA